MINNTYASSTLFKNTVLNQCFKDNFRAIPACNAIMCAKFKAKPVRASVRISGQFVF